jgi:hypothetical protein
MLSTVDNFRFQCGDALWFSGCGFGGAFINFTAQDVSFSTIADLRPGDIVGFSGADLGSDIINLATWGIPRIGVSHVAICGWRERDFGLVLYESTTMCKIPCAIKGKCINGVQCHWPAERIRQYRGKVYHYPLVTPLSHEEAVDLSEYLRTFIGTPYDAIGAFRSRDAGLGPIERRLHRESLSSIFCSEYCAAGERRVKRFASGNCSKFNPNFMCRTFVAQHVCQQARRIKCPSC